MLQLLTIYSAFLVFSCTSSISFRLFSSWKKFIFVKKTQKTLCTVFIWLYLLFLLLSIISSFFLYYVGCIDLDGENYNIGEYLYKRYTNSLGEKECLKCACKIGLIECGRYSQCEKLHACPEVDCSEGMLIHNPPGECCPLCSE